VLTFRLVGNPEVIQAASNRLNCIR